MELEKLLLILLVFFTIAAITLLVLSDGVCKSKGRALGYDTSWGPLQECIYTLPDGQKVTTEQLNNIYKKVNLEVK